MGAGSAAVESLIPWRAEPVSQIVHYPQSIESRVFRTGQRRGFCAETLMSVAQAQIDAGGGLVVLAQEATAAAEALLADATVEIRGRVMADGRTVSRMLDREQRAAHGLAWLATYVQALRQLAAYAARARDTGRLGETEDLIVRIGVGEYYAQILGGIPMSQGEIVRLADLGLNAAKVAARVTPAFEAAVTAGN